MTSNTFARFGTDSVMPPPAPRSADLLAALDAVVESAEPVSVFSSVARLCVPAYCDAVTVTVIDPSGRGHRIEVAGVRPVNGADQTPPQLNVTEINQASWVESARPHAEGDSAAASFSGTAGDIRGELVLWFRRQRPAGSQLVPAEVLVRVLADRALAVLQREQLTALASAANARADNLEVALASSRDIGMAIGILMERFKLSAEQGFDLIVRISQHDRRKVRDIAHEITETGEVVLPPEVELIARPVAAHTLGSSADPNSVSRVAGRPGPGRPMPNMSRPARS